MEDITDVKLKLYDPLLVVNHVHISSLKKTSYGFGSTVMYTETIVIHDEWLYDNYDCLILSGYIDFLYTSPYDEEMKYRLVSDRCWITDKNQFFLDSKNETKSNDFIKIGDDHITTTRVIENNMYVTMPKFLMSDYFKWKLKK